MKRQIISLMFLALTGQATLAQSSDLQRQPAPQIVGGWRVAKSDKTAFLAAAQAVRAIGRPHVHLAAINSVETQIVAGTNYRLRLTLSDGSRWEALVWRHLNGTLEVTSTNPRS